MSETPLAADEELVRFLSAPAPRMVPAAIRRGALRERGPLRMFFIGALILAIGMVFAKFFLPWRQLDEWRLAANHPAAADGIIVSAEEANARINGTQVMRYDFKFTPAGQRAPVFGECFTTGRRWTTGNRVRVNYDPDKPGLACVVGARLSESPLIAAVVLIFPLIGATLIVSSFWLRFRTLWLLRNGTLGDFRVAAIEPILVKVKGQMQPWMVYNNIRYKITLRRIDQSDAKPHEVRWWQPKLVAFVRERQASGRAVFGLFDPAKPKKVLLPEAWGLKK